MTAAVHPFTRRRQRRWHSSALLLTLLLSCDEPTNDADATVDMGERLETVRGIVDGAVLPIYRDFAEAAGTLEQATTAWAASGDTSDLEAARAAWIVAMDAWQVAELTLLGPAGAMDLVVAGEDLRDEIYSWPVINRCRVDQELASGDYADVATFVNESVNVRGLDALEALLFVDGEDNGCAPNATLNTSGDWAAIVSELPMRRAAYAGTAAQLVRQAADQLLIRWEGDFAESVRSAGNESTVYGSAQEALNAISNALFFLDTEVKDMKVGVPSGIAAGGCATDVCPEQRESRWANRSLPHVVANLRGFRLVFTGGEGRGFDDLLAERGADELTTQILEAIDAAETTLESVEGDVPTALMRDPAALDDSYAAIKVITDLLKTQFITVLDLELPMRAEGDND